MDRIKEERGIHKIILTLFANTDNNKFYIKSFQDLISEYKDREISLDKVKVSETKNGYLSTPNNVTHRKEKIEKAEMWFIENNPSFIENNYPKQEYLLL